MMLYPTIDQLTKGEFNRYELAVATAKCARIMTDEYVREREMYEKMTAVSKDSIDRVAIPQVDPRLRDEKAVKVAVEDIYRGDFKIEKAPEEAEL